MSIVETITRRYSELAHCCTNLSCGNSIAYANLKIGEVVLDLGCGQGKDVHEASKRVGQSGHVYGVDITQEMIEKAKENIKQKNVTFLHTSFDSIPLPENSIDCVLSNCAVNHSVDKLSVLKEVKRILKSGGRFILSDIFAVKKIPPEISMDKEAIAACYGGAVLLSEMAQMAEEAGFFVFDIREKGDPYLKENVELFSATIKIM